MLPIAASTFLREDRILQIFRGRREEFIQQQKRNQFWTVQSTQGLDSPGAQFNDSGLEVILGHVINKPFWEQIEAAAQLHGGRGLSRLHQRERWSRFSFSLSIFKRPSFPLFPSQSSDDMGLSCHVRFNPRLIALKRVHNSSKPICFHWAALHWS